MNPSKNESMQHEIDQGYKSLFYKVEYVWQSRLKMNP